MEMELLRTKHLFSYPEHSIAWEHLCRFEYPWEALDSLKEFILAIGPKLPCEVYECRGEGGFGYDPIFVTESGLTFAELSAEEKDAISHRGVAMRKFARLLAEYICGS